MELHRAWYTRDALGRLSERMARDPITIVDEMEYISREMLLDILYWAMDPRAQHVYTSAKDAASHQRITWQKSCT